MTSVALVVSPSRQVRDALKACIRHLDVGCRVQGVTSADAQPLLKGTATPQLVVLDLDALRAHDAATVRTLAERFRPATLAVTSDSVDPTRIENALRAGALAYIPKAYAAQQKALVLALALSGAGHRPHMLEGEAGLRARPVHEAEAGSPAAPPAERARASAGGRLTPKEVEVLSHAAAGLSNKQIAKRLRITEGTVKLHMTSIYRKLKVERRAKAIVVAPRLEEVRRQQIEQGQRGDLALEWLLPYVGHRRLKPGEVVFRKGDPALELFYLERGCVRLEDLGVDMGPGQFFGEVGVFSPEQARTSTARCLTQVELLCLGSEQAKSMYYLNPQFALHIVTLLAQRLVAERTQ